MYVCMYVCMKVKIYNVYYVCEFINVCLMYVCMYVYLNGWGSVRVLVRLMYVMYVCMLCMYVCMKRRETISSAHVSSFVCCSRFPLTRCSASTRRSCSRCFRCRAALSSAELSIRSVFMAELAFKSFPAVVCDLRWKSIIAPPPPPLEEGLGAAVTCCFFFSLWEYFPYSPMASSYGGGGGKESSSSLWVLVVVVLCKGGACLPSFPFTLNRCLVVVVVAVAEEAVAAELDLIDEWW